MQIKDASKIMIFQFLLTIVFGFIFRCSRIKIIKHEFSLINFFADKNTYCFIICSFIYFNNNFTSEHYHLV